MYNCNTDSLGLILGVEVFFSEGHCSGALCTALSTLSLNLGRNSISIVAIVCNVREVVRLRKVGIH